MDNPPIGLTFVQFRFDALSWDSSHTLEVKNLASRDANLGPVVQSIPRYAELAGKGTLGPFGLDGGLYDPVHGLKIFSNSLLT